MIKRSVTIDVLGYSMVKELILYSKFVDKLHIILSILPKLDFIIYDYELNGSKMFHQSKNVYI